APVAGLGDYPRCAPRQPIPVVAFYGTADPFILYTGGIGPAALALPDQQDPTKTVGQTRNFPKDGPVMGPSIPTIAARWARRNGCTSAAPTERAVARDVTLLAWSCPPGGDVALYRVDGGGHTWPGGTFFRSLAAVVGPTTFSVSADDVIW